MFVPARGEQQRVAGSADPSSPSVEKARLYRRYLVFYMLVRPVLYFAVFADYDRCVCACSVVCVCACACACACVCVRVRVACMCM